MPFATANARPDQAVAWCFRTPLSSWEAATWTGYPDDELRCGLWPAVEEFLAERRGTWEPWFFLPFCWLGSEPSQQKGTRKKNPSDNSGSSVPTTMGSRSCVGSRPRSAYSSTVLPPNAQRCSPVPAIAPVPGGRSRIPRPVPAACRWASLLIIVLAAGCVVLWLQRNARCRRNHWFPA